MPAANTVAQMQVVVTADTSQAESSLGALNTKVGSVSGALGTAFTGAAVAGAAGLAAGLAACVTSAADFEKTMSGVKAVSGATAEEMSGLSGLALRLGKDTSFSASEAAAGIEELVKGGLTIPDIMNGAAEATLNLAAAGGVSLPEAATIAANALAQFNLKGEDMAHVSDLIAGAANASALDVSDFKFSLQAAGAVASTMGFSFDDLAQSIAVMGKAGITGSDAGTSLKTMMMRLVPSTNAARDMMRELGIVTGDINPVLDKMREGLSQTEAGQARLAELTKKGLINSQDELFKSLDKLNPQFLHGAESAIDFGVQTGLLGNQFFDASGKVKSMADVAQVLQDALSGMSEEQKIATMNTLFGSDAIRAAAVMAKEGAAGFDEMAASMAKVTAKEVGAERLKNLMGSVEQLKGSLETLAITIGIELLPIIKDFVDGLTSVANEAIPEAESAAKAFAATLKEWIPVITTIVRFLWDHRDAIVAVVAALATFTMLTTVVGWITTAVAAFTAITTAISASGGVIAALTALVALLGGPVTLIIAAVALAVGVMTLAWTQNWGDIQGKTEAVVEFLSGVPDTISGYWDAIASATEGLMTAISDAWTDVKETTTTIWNGIKGFLEEWWRAILIALTGPVGAVAVLIYDNWTEIQTTTETIFRAIANLLTAIWEEIYTRVIQPKLDAIKTAISTAWEEIKTAIDTASSAISTAISTAWDAISTKTTEAFNAVLAFVRDTIFEPMRQAIETAVNAARDLVNAAWDAISAHAHAVLDPILSYLRDTIFGPIQQAVEQASNGITTAFEGAVNAVKTAVDSTMGGVKTTWETVWGAIQRAAESPKAALNEVIAAIEKLKNVMPDWLIPHSPTPFEMGIRGIADAVAKMNDTWKSLGSAIKGANGEIASYIANAAAARGIDPGIALRIAQHEGGLEEYNKVGKFATGWSWWPFQLHYGGKGYEHFGTTAGMGNTFTKETGWAPGDPKAWKDSVDYALDHARRYGWGAWYGRGPAGVGAWEGIPGHAAGGWVGLNGPELGWLGERGPEYVIPTSALSSSPRAAMQHVVIDVAIAGRVAEQIYVEGRELAIRRGRHAPGLVPFA